MTQQTIKPSSINTSARCNHHFANGRRCRLYATSNNPSFCPAHSDVPHRPASAEVAATLTAGLDDFTDPVQINTFLSRLLLLLAQDKISTKRASVLTYISSQLLHSVPTIQKHEDKQPVEIIFDIPRPQRPDYVEPPKREPPEAHNRPTPEVPKEVRKDAPQSTPAPVSQPSSSLTTPQAKPLCVSPRGAPNTTSPAGPPATPAAMPNPALPGSFGLPQADPLGGSRTPMRPSVRQPSWADRRT